MLDLGPQATEDHLMLVYALSRLSVPVRLCRPSLSSVSTKVERGRSGARSRPKRSGSWKSSLAHEPSSHGAGHLFRRCEALSLRRDCCTRCKGA
jgi:hypothetical protein